MKRKRLPKYPVKCSFCKEKKAECKIVGGEHGGKTICNECFNKINIKETVQKYLSHGEEQAYRMYRVY